MLHTTKGIVIHQFKYGEKSIIAKIYTEKFGLQSYIINGVRSKKSANKFAYLQPLSLVDVNAYHKENKGLQQLKDIKLDVPFRDIPFNVYKGSIAFFIAEVIYKTIREEEPNSDLFHFLYHSVQVLDVTEKNYANFHIYFLTLFAKYLGFPPQVNTKLNAENKYFDLQEGVFLPIKPFHPAYIDSEASQIVLGIIQHHYQEIENTVINNKLRANLLQALLDYYKIHAVNFDTLKTKEVLEELFV